MHRHIIAFILAACAIIGLWAGAHWIRPAAIELGGDIQREIALLEVRKPDLLLIGTSYLNADMLVVCVEAGHGLDAAIQRVGREIAVAHPELADELTLVSLELRAGKSREEALRSLGERTGVEAVQSLASLLIQAEHFGTSIASALREHAEEMRTIRLQRAREKAAKLPVKMIFPIMFFIFPSLFLVILGPALVRIYASFISGF